MRDKVCRRRVSLSFFFFFFVGYFHHQRAEQQVTLNRYYSQMQCASLGLSVVSLPLPQQHKRKALTTHLFFLSFFLSFLLLCNVTCCNLNNVSALSLSLSLSE